MKVGTALTISIGNDEAERKIYRTKLMDITDDRWIIDYPLSANPEQTRPIRKNAEITIDYIDKGNVYTFKTVVVDIIEGANLVFVIPKPQKEDITKIQRREFVRIETDEDVAVYSANDTFEPFTTVTQDISGGGACIILPKNVELKVKDLLQLFIVLRSPYSDYQYIEVPAEVVRTGTRNEVRTASLKFLFNDDQLQQKIIKHCFELQRQMLQQNMMLT